MVRHRQREIGAAYFAIRRAKAVEGLGARHLMDEMAVDVEEGGAILALRDDMRVPDLIVEHAGGGFGRHDGDALTRVRRIVSVYVVMGMKAGIFVRRSAIPLRSLER